MLETLIVHKERITRSREMKYFQIPLPGTVKTIIGVEASVFLFSQLPVPPPEKGGGGSGPTPPPCPNPGNATITELSNTVAGGVRTHVFKIGSAVNPTFKYSAGVYSVTVEVTAVDGDTPWTIALKLGDAVNNTTLAQWNQYGGSGNNYKPAASVDNDQITLTVDSVHQFAAWGSGSCTGAPPPPPPVLYDPLFAIKANEKAGVLSLQSPDRTDIFYQGEVYRQDKNIMYGDYCSKQFLELDQWCFGKRRTATDVLITTASPILEAYYKDDWGVTYNMDVTYILNIFIWIKKSKSYDQ